MKQKILLICFTVSLMLVCSTSVMAQNLDTITLEKNKGSQTSRIITVPMTDLVFWFVENTGQKNLHYNVMSWPSGNLIDSGIVAPGKWVSKQKYGSNFKEFNVTLMIYGESTGKGIISVK